MPTLQEIIETAAGKANDASKIIHDVANGPAMGPGSDVQTANGLVPTLAKKLFQLAAEYAANNVVTTVIQAKLDAEAAADQAEAARDQAIAAAIVPTPADANKWRRANATGTGDEYHDLPAASTVTPGITAYATPAEAEAGIVSNKALTPAALGGIKAVDQIARDNIALQSLLRATDHQAALQSYEDMVSDKFVDTSGVDISSFGGVLNGNPASSGSHTQATSPFVAIKFTAPSSNPVDKVGIFVPSGGAFVSQDIRIETDNNNAPSGALVHANAEILNCNGVANQLNEWSFTGSFNLVPGKVYWLVVSRNAVGNYSIAKVTSGAGQEVAYFNGAITTSYALGYRITYKDIVGLSSNVFYSDSQKCLGNRAVTQVATGVGTAVGTMSSGGGLAKAFDGNTIDNTTTNGGTAPWGSPGATIGKDWGAGNTKIPYKVRLFAPCDRGFQNDGNWTTGVGSFTLNCGPDLATPTELAKITGIDNSKMPGKVIELVTDIFVPARVVWVTALGFTFPTISEMQIFEISTPANMELISKPFTAAYVPAKAALLALIQSIDPMVWNTDVKFWVTREDTASWVQVPMAYVGDFSALQKILTGGGSLTGASTALMRWKITTHNLKEIRVHGASIMWRP